MTDAQFVALIDEHQAIIHKISRLYRDSREDREDLFQEIVLQLWRSIGSFRGEAKFSTWMYRVALTTAISSLRKKKPQLVYPAELPDRKEPVADGHEQQEQLMRALRQLSDAEKALITLYLEDISYAEMAAITGISENYVGVKLKRIKTKIQQLLNKP
ncbi:RNA polymerase sigma factor [Paraflavitalea pollutisoli]|uniref:RNA polymerase sigma factor n=1 Tax=Paraflavitalea pollutisoli TaxID=3034143 RepID=UPI0023EBB9E6|nr:sigma-70 family RNA polymerase sigma factor [Paraflavitalea sp. H1-2-19X]